MIKAEYINVCGFEAAIRGMRNPMNSWDKSDSQFDSSKGICELGQADLDLMHKLYLAGTEHRKYARQILVSMDIVAPIYWWKEFDTYKVGTTSNSCSTMHKIQDKQFKLEDFSADYLFNDFAGSTDYLSTLQTTIDVLNKARDEFNSIGARLKYDSELTEAERKHLKSRQKLYWWQMIQLLPSSYNQRRTITLTYENVFSIIHQRKNHKLDEWNILVDEYLLKLPYIKSIIE